MSCAMQRTKMIGLLLLYVLHLFCSEVLMMVIGNKSSELFGQYTVACIEFDEW